jgi:hypothetical protein
MDVVWDQDVRNILCGIISRETAGTINNPVGSGPPDEATIKGHITLAIRYADLLEEARRKKSNGGRTEVSHLTRGNKGGYRG